MRRILLIAFALLLGDSQASAWEEYNYPDQGVAIQFPGKPQMKKSTYDSIYVKGLPSTVYSVEDDHIVFQLTVIDLQSQPDRGADQGAEGVGVELGADRQALRDLTGTSEVELRRNRLGRGGSNETSISRVDKCGGRGHRRRTDFGFSAGADERGSGPGAQDGLGRTGPAGHLDEGLRRALAAACGVRE